jgi:hypothetical protein
MSGMTTTAAAYRLVRIDRGSGQCDHCGRNLGRLCVITDGTREMTVGQRCCIELTGWTPDAARLRQQAREDAARAKFGGLYDSAMDGFRAAPNRAASTLYWFAATLMLEGHDASYYHDEWLTVEQIIERAAAQ